MSGIAVENKFRADETQAEESGEVLFFRVEGIAQGIAEKV